MFNESVGKYLETQSLDFFFIYVFPSIPPFSAGSARHGLMRWSSFLRILWVFLFEHERALLP